MRFEISEILRQDQVMNLVHGNNSQPRNVLGRHYVKNGQVICAYHPDAVGMKVIDDKGNSYDMDMVERQSVFALFLPSKKEFPYKIEMTFRDGNTYLNYDPYSFPCQITKEEENAFLKGQWLDAYKKMGCHCVRIQDVDGVYFATWAPSARRVSVVGDFNFWNGMIYPMHRLENSGIFELFIPGIMENCIYKFEIKMAQGDVVQYPDPFAMMRENAKGNASKILNINSFRWNDDRWMRRRKYRDARKMPVVVCDVQRGRNMAEDELFDGSFTHLLFSRNIGMVDGECEYSSPVFYQTYCCNGDSDNFRRIIDKAHQEEMGVLIELAAEYYEGDPSGMKSFDGTSLYGFADDRFGGDKERGVWRLCFGKPEVMNYILSGFIFWMKEYHVDGFVFQGLKNLIAPAASTSNNLNVNAQREMDRIIRENREFLSHTLAVLRQVDPGVMLIAHEKVKEFLQGDKLFAGHRGFDCFWIDRVRENIDGFFACDERERRGEHYRLTLPLQKENLENALLLLNHKKRDDFRQSSIDIDFKVDYAKLAEEKMSAAYMLGAPGKKAWAEHGVHESVRRYVHSLFQIYTKYSMLYECGTKSASFEWINGMDAVSSVVSFIRRSVSGRESLLFVSNFSSRVVESYQVGVPMYGTYRLISNSDAAEFGGSGRFGEQRPAAVREGCDFRPYSIEVSLPPLTTLIFEYAPGAERGRNM